MLSLQETLTNDYGRYKSSRVGFGDQPKPSPLTEPYVRASYTAPGFRISSHFRQGSGFDARQIEQPLLGKPSAGHGHADQRTPRIPPAAHVDLGKLAPIA